MGFLKYKPGILNFISQLKFPEEDFYQAPGPRDINLKMTGSLKYKPGIFLTELKLETEI